MRKRREVDVAKPLIRWLVAQDWEIYQEVQPHGGGPIADIVAKREQLIWAIEVKQSLTASLVDQAKYWIGAANYVSVAVPPIHRWPKGRGVLIEYMRWKGIGLICSICDTYDYKTYHDKVREDEPPKLYRRISSLLLFDSLCDAHKTYAEAGNSDGKRWTPFQETVELVKETVCGNPGITVKEMVEICKGKHHYASSATFRSCIPKYVMSGVIEGIVIDDSSRPYRYYPEGNHKC